MRHSRFGVAWLLISMTACSAARERYESAVVDEAGQLRIRTARGVEIVADKDAEQVGFDEVAISQDGRAVGWLALFENCCTSYPVPLKLVVHANGRAHSFAGNGLPVWRWMFVEGGRQVAFYQETVHGGLGGHYELRDLRTDRLVAEFDNDSAGATAAPPWAMALDSARTARTQAVPR